MFRMNPTTQTVRDAIAAIDARKPQSKPAKASTFNPALQAPRPNHRKYVVEGGVVFIIG